MFVLAYEYAFAALADPTRRRIFERLRKRPRAVGELARHLGVTQPAVSQHLAVLRKARLVRSRAVGTTHLYQPDVAGIEAMRRYLDLMWTDVLAAYAGSFEQE